MRSNRSRRRRNERFEAIVSLLVEALSEPTPELPSVHCLSKISLDRILKPIRAEIKARGLGEIRSNLAVVRSLLRADLLKSVPLEGIETGELLPKLFLFDVEPPDAIDVHPVELLQAAEPQGVICYFTALEVHELTTQPTPHHHVAKLVDPRPANAISEAAGNGASRTYDPLGSALFTYQGLPYYLTRRETSLLVEHQIRFLDSRTLFRVTTLEQTLVDTLHRPLSCGGPSVVFESWRTAADRFDDERLAEILEHIDRNDVDRRVGWMLEHLEHPSAGRLAERLELARASVTAGPTDAPLLLRGFENPELDHRWWLWTP